MLLSSQEKQTLTIWLASFTTSRGTDWGSLMAAATLTAIPVVVFFMLVHRRVAFGLTAGAVKSSDVERLAAACLPPELPGEQARPKNSGCSSAVGVTLFAYNARDPEQLASLTGRLREAGGDLLLAIDEEGGDVTRLESARGSSFPAISRSASSTTRP